MSDTSFDVSPDVKPMEPRETVDYVGRLRVAFRRPIEQTWLPTRPMIICDDAHGLLSAMRVAFYDHFPLRISPDVMWITLAHGFALHVNEHSEQLRHRFVKHQGKKKLVVSRTDFLPGRDNPWPEAFDEFRGILSTETGGLSSLLEANFSTTRPVHRAVCQLLAMDTFKAYFEYEMLCGCGIPKVILTGTLEDWQEIRRRVRSFAEYGLDEWVNTLDPILAEFELAKSGSPRKDFWKSMFRYHSGSGPAVMTGWVNALFPYLKFDEKLTPNPNMKDWRRRLEIDDQQHWRERFDDPQGFGLEAVPACMTSVPLNVVWGEKETPMRLVGGLLGVTQDDDSLTVETECGWVVLYEEPISPKFDPFERHRIAIDDSELADR